MSLSSESARKEELEEYESLVSYTTRLKTGTQNFMDAAVALHTKLIDAGDKAEVVAVRDQLKTDLQAILNSV